MMKRKRFGSAFTLVELAMVTAIIGILAAIAVPNFLNATIRAKVARAEAEQELLLWALEMYRIDQEFYPQNLVPGEINISDLVPLTTPIPYMSELPIDAFLYPADADRRTYVEEVRNGNPHYFYVNFLQSNGERISLVPYGRNGSANYVIYGMGPKYLSDPLSLDPMQAQQFISYSPSNGTTSTGLIRTFGP